MQIICYWEFLNVVLLIQYVWLDTFTHHNMLLWGGETESFDSAALHLNLFDKIPSLSHDLFLSPLDSCVQI